MQLSQVEPQPLERFIAAVGVGRLLGPYERRTSLSDTPIYRWQVSGRNAKAAMTELWPYLSAPKKEQFRQVMEQVNAVR